MSNVEELLKLATALAKDGEWRVSPEHHRFIEVPGCDAMFCDDSQVATYLALVQPNRIAPLLEELLELRDKIETLRRLDFRGSGGDRR